MTSVLYYLLLFVVMAHNSIENLVLEASICTFTFNAQLQLLLESKH